MVGGPNTCKAADITGELTTKVLMFNSMSNTSADSTLSSMPTSPARSIDALADTQNGDSGSSAGIMASCMGFMMAKPKSTLWTSRPTALALT